MTATATGLQETSASSGCAGLAQTHLTVKDIMTADVVTVSPAETVFAAIQRMCDRNISCVVVVDDDAIMGILTQKDLLASMGHGQEGYRRLPVAERMSSPAIVARSDLPVIEAGRILKTKHIKHLPIVANEHLVGIVSQTDITRGLIYLTPLQRTSEVMNPTVETIGPEATVADAARLMKKRGVTGLVVTHAGKAVGVVSQKDILVRVLSHQKNPACTLVADVMSTPVLPIQPDSSVFTASRMMDKMYIHRLVVQDGKRICGIISQTDILQAVERRLRSEETDRLFPVCSDIPLFVLDARATLTYVNAAVLKLFGFEAYEEIVGRPLSDEAFWSGEKDRTRLLGLLDRKRPGLLKLAMRACDDTPREIVLLLSLTKNACDAISGWQGVIWDLRGHEPITQAEMVGWRGRETPKTALAGRAPGCSRTEDPIWRCLMSPIS